MADVVGKFWLIFFFFVVAAREYNAKTSMSERRVCEQLNTQQIRHD